MNVVEFTQKIVELSSAKVVFTKCGYIGIGNPTEMFGYLAEEKV